jgi:hypothetical protein
MDAEGPDAVWVLTVPVSMPNALPALLAMRKGFRGETAASPRHAHRARRRSGSD